MSACLDMTYDYVCSASLLARFLPSMFPEHVAVCMPCMEEDGASVLERDRKNSNNSYRMSLTNWLVAWNRYDLS